MDNQRLRRSLVVAVALLLAGATSAPSAAPPAAAPPSAVQEAPAGLDLPGNLPLPPKGDPKLDSRLDQLAGILRDEGEEAARQFAEVNDLSYGSDGRVRVLIHENAVPASRRRPRTGELQHVPAEEALFGAMEQAVRARVDSLGGAVRGQVRNVVEADIPLAAIRVLPGPTEISWVQASPVPQVQDVISQGVWVTRAQELQDSSVSFMPSAERIRVGVLDVGFEGYRALLGRELPSSVTARSFHSAGIGAGSRHGTACAEIVHDMAPEADLVLANFDSVSSHHDAVSWLISQDVNVISCSAGWANQLGPGDGRGPINDDVERALSAGIQWVNAAGDDAENHWQARFHDPDNDGWHNFSGADETNEVRLKKGELLSVSLDWDDWFYSDQDYDLYVFDQDMQLLFYSNSRQTGFQWPTEIVRGIAPRSLTAHVAIKRYRASRSVRLQTFSPGQKKLEYIEPEGSLTIPADTDGAIAVGATHWSNDVLEPFSSQGPTADGRTKPDISAPDGVVTVSLSPFYGSSAATPHVAGAIALMKSRFGIYSFDEIVTILLARAIDRGAPGKDNQYGHGRLDVIGQDQPRPPSGTTYDIAVSVDAADKFGGIPGAGLLVQDGYLAGRTYTTGDDGKVTLTDAQGYFHIKATAAGFRSQSKSIGPPSTPGATQPLAFRLERQSGFDNDLGRRLQAALDDAVEDYQLPGAVLAVRSPTGEVWTGTSGRGRVAGAVLADGSSAGGTDVPMSLDLHFHIGSLTKSFTATAILQLVDEGKISLDNSVAQVIEEWLLEYFDFAIPYADQITVRDLLSMRSGMGNYSFASEFFAVANEDPLRQWDPRELIRFGVESDDTPAYPPNTRFEYNNANFILLGIFIEQITGNTYPEEITTRILEPLGLRHTSVPANESMPEPYARGYKYDEQQGRLMDLSRATDPSWGWAAGSMISTVEDLLNWVPALVDGTLVSPEMQRERLRLRVGEIHDLGRVRYGLGIYDDHGALGHGGDYSGFYTAYGVRHTGYDIAVLENGKLRTTGQPYGIPSRAILFRAIEALGLEAEEVSGPTPPKPPDRILSPQIEAAMETSPFDQGRWGLLVVDAETGETVYSAGLERKYETGSTAKTFSVGSALDVLGPDYRFITPVVRRGEVDEAGTLNGDLILVAQGDLTMGGRTDEKGGIAVSPFDHTDANAIPGLATLTPQDPLGGLDILAQQVAASGIRRVQGDVLVDERLWELHLAEHGLPVSSIMINDNLLDLMFTPTDPGALAGFDWRPQTASFRVRSRVVTGEPGSPIEVASTLEGTRLTVTGSVPAGIATVPVIQTFQAPDPASFARTLLIEALGRAGVAVDSAATGSNPAPKLPPDTEVAGLPRVAVLISPTLAEEAKLILKVSHNLGAHTMPLLLGVAAGKPTYADGMRIEREHVARAIGADAADLSLHSGDGSNDQVLPATQVAWLRYLRQRPCADAFRAGLPILGVDGSLSSVAVDSPAAGHVFAKTGTRVTGDESGISLKTKALAGYIDAASGRQLVFALYVNDVPITSIDDIMAANDLLGQIAAMIQQAQ